MTLLNVSRNTNLMLKKKKTHKKIPKVEKKIMILNFENNTMTRDIRDLLPSR